MTTNKPEAVAYRYTASRSFGKRNRKWHYQDSFPHAANREVAEIGQMEELIRLIDYEALQAECEKLRKDAERYRWLRDPCSGAERVVMYGRGDYGRGLMAYTMLDEAIDAAMAGKGATK